MSSELNSQSPWMKDLYTVNNPGEELKYYQQTAEDYERTLRGLKYRGTDILFIALKKFEEKTGISVPRNGKCIDIGAGTGMSGESLRSAGFTGVVDALEPSDNMYSIAEQKGMYSTRYSDLLLADKETSVAGKSYDLVFSCGVFNNRSTTSDCLPEVVRMAKKGGVIANVMNNHYWESGFEAVIKNLEDNNVAQLKHTEVVDQYYEDKKGRVFILCFCIAPLPYCC
ncbi:uncharacterized protein LOC142352129 isoform X2 [Convolutriloba macropyga]